MNQLFLQKELIMHHFLPEQFQLVAHTQSVQAFTN